MRSFKTLLMGRHYSRIATLRLAVEHPLTMRVNSRTNNRMKMVDHILILSDEYCQAVGLSVHE